MPRVTRRLALAAITILAAASATAVYASTDGGSTTQPAPGPFGDTAKTQIKAVEPDLASSFAGFRRERSAADAIPDDVRALLGETELTGKNPNLARAIKSNSGTAWMIPGDGTLCIALPDPYDIVVLGCTSTAHALGNGAVVTEVDPLAKSALVGLTVPDGGHASLTYDDGQTVPVALSADGTALLSVSFAAEGKTAEEITITTRDDREHSTLIVPPALAAAFVSSPAAG